jgi:hypothetical protein
MVERRKIMDDSMLIFFTDGASAIAAFAGDLIQPLDFIRADRCSAG